jgi:tetratricopeptide (TPR) repeat protein
VSSRSSPSIASLRRPSGSGGPEVPRSEPPVPLRLTVARGALGLELYEAVEIGPLEVARLSLVLPGLNFPLDVSGGVPTFRHRRGDLEHVELRLSLTALARWLEPRLRQVMGGNLERPVRAWVHGAALGVGAVGTAGALAFDLLWAPVQGDARFVVAGARGARLGAPALGFALRALDAAFSGTAERRGRIASFARAGLRIGRAVMPAVGARAPAAGRVRFGEFEVDGDLLHVELDSENPAVELGLDAARALELGELAADADEALARGDLDAARAGYLTALERAPRHPELARLVAEIDASVGGRAEAALGMLVETTQATEAGAIGAELLGRTGDFDGARRAIEVAARSEPFAPLAAMLWARLAELEPSLGERLACLDHAVSLAPALGRVRRARFVARLERGDVAGALADAEHLEAEQSGARQRYEACLGAGRALADAGFARDAGKMFERALRYVPDDAQATAGLARALSSAGQRARALGLFERAVEIGERVGQADAAALLDLGKAVAADLGDLPQAVARVRQVPPAAPEAVEARALEGRWRAQLGDVAGASLAYARLRELGELEATHDRRAAAWLTEAARFERDVQGDVLAAERHLAIALKVAPHDRAVGEAYRQVAAALAARERRARDGADPPAGETASPAHMADTAHGADLADARDAELAERLEARLHGDPENMTIVLELAETLERLGRDRELFALLSARLEDAEPRERAQLEPRALAVLERLAREARGRGNAAEALLYEQALARFGRRA